MEEDTRPLRILVADTWGTAVHPSLARQFPNVTWSIHTRTNSAHPHGHQVAECLAKMLPPDREVEICFYPYLSLQDRRPHGWAEVVAEARDQGRPFSLVNCSFGAHHEDSAHIKRALTREWMDGSLLKYYMSLLQDTPVVFASGNHDSTSSRTQDLDNDVCYPQRPLSVLDNVFVVGACDRRGVPTDWSADGLEVTCSYLGHQVKVLDPVTGRYTRVDGTSFASPFCAGDMAACLLEGHKITREYFEAYVQAHGLIPRGWERGRRHPKDGLGVMLPSMRRRLGYPVETLVKQDQPAEFFDLYPQV